MMPSCIPKSYSNRVLASLPAIEMRQIDAAFITGRFAERPYLSTNQDKSSIQCSSRRQGSAQLWPRWKME
jgi:hypothetical protein